MPIITFRRLVRRARYGEPIVVVTGLPRSGTSMMMQMLEAGGLDLVTDGLRTADESNPQGYYELERVKELAEAVDHSWLRDARGRGVKVIAYLLRYLPPSFNYKVIFMQRHLDEVLVSQTKMLARRGEGSETSDARMRELFIDHLARTKSVLAHRSCFDALHVHYAEVLADAGSHARLVSRFLGGGLDPDAMAAVVDPGLYRNRR